MQICHIIIDTNKANCADYLICYKKYHSQPQDGNNCWPFFWDGGYLNEAGQHVFVLKITI